MLKECVVKRMRSILVASRLVALFLLVAVALVATRAERAVAEDDPVVLPECGQAGAAPLSATLFPSHEDSSVKTRIDLGALNPADYLSLGVTVAKEDGVDYFPGPPGFSLGATIRELTPGGCFDRAFSNLNPGKTYEICLIGIQADFTSTGLFSCVSVQTEAKKRETALLITNSRTERIDSAIDDWVDAVKRKNRRLSIRRVEVSRSITVEKLYELIHRQYLTRNVTTVILGSPGLPLPIVDNFGALVSYSGAYTTLSRGFGVDDGFFNPTNDLFEVTIVSWGAPSNTILKQYLHRVIRYYEGSIRFSRRLLVANAMIPDELPLGKSDFVDARYPENRVEYVGDITAYLDDVQGSAWRERYASLLTSLDTNRSYELLLIEAHGSTAFHYPCDSAGCVDAPFIRDAVPRAQLVVAASCSIANQGVADSPMSAYVFEGRSLGGLGAEITFFTNAGVLLDIKSRLEAGTPVGEAGRRYGFTAFGDPFLRLP